jgi:hypothetical protein
MVWVFWIVKNFGQGTIRGSTASPSQYRFSGLEFLDPVRNNSLAHNHLRLRSHFNLKRSSIWKRSIAKRVSVSKAFEYVCRISKATREDEMQLHGDQWFEIFILNRHDPPLVLQETFVAGEWVVCQEARIASTPGIVKRFSPSTTGSSYLCIKVASYFISIMKSIVPLV